MNQTITTTPTSRIIKVVRRRQGGNNRECNEDWENDDDYIRLHIAISVGCVPPQWRKHITRILMR